jgi:hypothetical protein
MVFVKGAPGATVTSPIFDSKATKGVPGASTSSSQLLKTKALMNNIENIFILFILKIFKRYRDKSCTLCCY